MTAHELFFKEKRKGLNFYRIKKYLVNSGYLFKNENSILKYIADYEDYVWEHTDIDVWGLCSHSRRELERVKRILSEKLSIKNRRNVIATHVIWTGISFFGILLTENFSTKNFVCIGLAIVCFVISIWWLAKPSNIKIDLAIAAAKSFIEDIEDIEDTQE